MTAKEFERFECKELERKGIYKLTPELEIELMKEYQKSEPYQKKIKKEKKNSSEKARQEVISHYGFNKKPMCCYCGETEFDYLTIDHIDNGRGNPASREHGSGSTLCYWIIKNNFPEGFQTLCFNCNMVKNTKGNMRAMELGRKRFINRKSIF